MNATFVGIDVSKDRLHAHVHPDGMALTVARDEAGLKALTNWLRTRAGPDTRT